jgi:gliding motility-associated-like protein
MKRITLLIFTFLSISCFAQFSKTHYIPPLSNANSLEPQGQFMYISSPSLTPVNFKIILIGNSIISGTVSRDLPYSLDLGNGFDTQLLITASDVGKIKSNKGYIIEAEDLVYVTVRLTATPQSYHAGGLVSKGLAALGTKFRIGAFTNTSVVNTNESHYTFASVLATENNTIVSFSDLKPNISLVNNAAAEDILESITLNSGESYIIAVQGPHNGNKDALIGASITSDKPIAVNCGSFGGTNGNLQNLDLGFDQIVSVEKTGREYIFIKGNGEDILERPLIVANEDDTAVFLNGSITPITTLYAGEYIALDGSKFSKSGNLYVKTSKNVFAYQSIGGTNSQANQNMHFVPPLSCETPKIINNIPFINQVGNNTTFTGTVCLVAEANASLDFIINGESYSLSTLPTGITVKGPLAVTGNNNYKTYTFQGLTGNISVLSTKSVYLSYYGSSGAATYGGFYSGFTVKPQITFGKINSTQSSCIPNTVLSVSEILGFDTYQWYYNKIAIPGETSNNYSPKKPGYYHVNATISTCGTTLVSDEIPVSNCPSNMGNDIAIDNIDIDNDKDGITNCTESNGNLGIDVSNFSSGSIKIGEYLNSFQAVVTTSGSNTAPIPFFGKNNGDFITEVPIGKGNTVQYEINFDKPVSIALEYVATADFENLINSNADFIVKSEIDKTITVLNPDNQLLIDTNYDGIYENGISEYSSFEIRFRVNSTTPLAAGTGTFSFRSYLCNSFIFIQKNSTDTSPNKATFSITATCIPNDTDTDGIYDQLDLDSDNDGVPDTLEAQNPYKTVTNTDINTNGLEDAYEPGLIPIDSDTDGIMNYLDLDSDNNGIYDLVESGSGATDSDSDGIIDGNTSFFGTNGLCNLFETFIDSGILNYSIQDSDSDEINNTIEADNDADSCPDVIEAGFSDANKDSYLGNTIPIINTKGIVINNTDGYTVPNNNYIKAVPILITSQPTNQIGCELQNAVFSIATNTLDTYQWQVSTDGIIWNSIIDNTTYSGSSTNTLTINGVINSMNNYKYRVALSKVGNICGLLSNEVLLTIQPLPIVTPILSLVQCETDIDGFSNFNLTEKNNFIATDYVNLTFTYYMSSVGANTADINTLITSPTRFPSSNGTIWAKVENANGCYSITQINLIVSNTLIPNSFNPTYYTCDDYIDTLNNDTDGISTFDFSDSTAAILEILPSPSSSYLIKYYKNENDALGEINEISNINSYRNQEYPNQQKIWVRVDNSFDNSCYGISSNITLQVNPKPNIDTNDDHIEDILICENTPSFLVQLNAGINDNTPINNYTYIWLKDNIIIPNEDNNVLEVTTEGIYTVKFYTQYGCSRERTIKVVASSIAVIEPTTILDLSDVNTITINASGQGDYEYSLDSPDGPFQISNFFSNVPAGIHEIFINDKKGCGLVHETIAVIGIPKFFTPNGDGYNDNWNIKGANTAINSESIVYIFDRYGKLLKQLSPSSLGWDGTFNGIQLPADDYWFTLKLGDGRESKGHFSLKR